MSSNIVFSPASSAQEQFLMSDADITFYGGAAGSGKALRHGEKVLTDVGFKNVEDIYIGETVITHKNTKEKVTGIFPQGVVDIYRVEMQDASTVDVCGEHLWSYHEARGRGKVKVDTTLHLLNRLGKGFRPIVPLTEPVGFDKEQLDIAPYTLGALIGDGCLVSTIATITSQDVEIIDRIRSEGYTVNRYSLEKPNNVFMYGVQKLVPALKKLSLYGKRSETKFIPEEYKRSTVEDRFNLIQGLMDTDGYVDAGGACYYSTASEVLASDIKQVLHSLGFTCSIKVKKTYYKNKLGAKVPCLDSYNLYIRGKYQSKLFSLPRKSIRTKFKVTGNRIISITKVASDYATCISISGEDRLFLTSNYIVTHNSHCLLGAFLKFCHHPRTRGVIFRRTTKQISNPGGLFDSAVNLYKKVDPKLRVKVREQELIFRSGAKLRFGYLDTASDKYNYQGSEITFLGFDEIQQLNQDNVVYLLSRLRSTSVDYKKQAFATGNPDYDSFIREWVEFALDERGIPIRKEIYPMRYMVQVAGGSLVWSDTKRELEDTYGGGDQSGILTFKFIPGTIYDNPPLMKADPTYISKLKALPRVEMERLLLGSWYARQQSSGLFKREWVQEVELPNGRAKKRIRAWDLAFSLPSEQYPNPDWTRGVLMSKDSTNVYTVEDLRSMRDRVHNVEKMIFETAVHDGQDVTVSIPLDPAAAAGAYARDLQRKLGEMGFNVRLSKPVKSKVTRFAPFSSVAQAGFINVVKADWNKAFYDELEVFDGDPKKKDDIADVCSDAFLLLNKELVIPTFSLPDFTGSNPFGSGASGVIPEYRSSLVS
jgi:predicted phage terminase large subunit-like protein